MTSMEQSTHTNVEHDADEKNFDLDIAHDELGKDGLRTVEAGLAADELIVDLDGKEESRILRKVDMRLVPLLSVLYL
jgi:hypothetical protein